MVSGISSLRFSTRTFSTITRSVIAFLQKAPVFTFLPFVLSQPTVRERRLVKLRLEPFHHERLSSNRHPDKDFFLKCSAAEPVNHVTPYPRNVLEVGCALDQSFHVKIWFNRLELAAEGRSGIMRVLRSRNK